MKSTPRAPRVLSIGAGFRAEPTRSRPRPDTARPRPDTARPPPVSARSGSARAGVTPREFLKNPHHYANTDIVPPEFREIKPGYVHKRDLLCGRAVLGRFVIDTDGTVPVAVVDNAPAGCGDTVVAALDLFLSQRYRPATRLGLPVKVLSGSVFSERR